MVDQVLVDHLRSDAAYEELRRSVPGYLLPTAREAYRTVRPEPIDGVTLRTAAVVLRTAKRLSARVLLDRERAARTGTFARPSGVLEIVGLARASGGGGAPPGNGTRLRRLSSSFSELDDVPL